MFVQHAAMNLTPSMQMVGLIAHLFLKGVIIAAIAYLLVAKVPQTITALNAMSPLLTALVVIFMGGLLLVISKWYGIDTTIAGGVIGAGTGILTTNGTHQKPGEPNPPPPDKPVTPQ